MSNIIKTLATIFLLAILSPVLATNTFTATVTTDNVEQVKASVVLRFSNVATIASGTLTIGDCRIVLNYDGATRMVDNDCDDERARFRGADSSTLIADFESLQNLRNDTNNNGDSINRGPLSIESVGDEERNRQLRFTTQGDEMSNTTITTAIVGGFGNNSTQVSFENFVTGTVAVAQVVEFTPVTSGVANTLYRITINGTDYDYITSDGDSTQTIVDELQPLVNGNSAVDCTQDASKITCTASTPGTAFSTSARTIIPPVITSTNTFTVNENQTQVATLTVTNADAITLTGTDAGAFSLTSAGVLTFNTAPDFETQSSYSITVTAMNSIGSVTQTIIVNVIDVDEVPVLLTTPVTLTATGRVSAFALTDFGVTVDDDKDTVTATVALVDNKTPTLTADGSITLTSGTHTLIWQASDSAGNEATKTQAVAVIPTVNFAPAQFSSAGQSPIVAAFLSGDAPNYPVQIQFTLTTEGTVTATADGGNNIITIAANSGNMGTKSITISGANLTTATATVTLTMGTVTGAVQGQTPQHEITVVNTNIAPRINNFTITQNNAETGLITTTDGTVSITASASDANGDNLTYAWSSTDVSLGNNTGTATTFDPQSLTTGTAVVISLAVSDGTLTATSTLNLGVVDSTAMADVDADGIQGDDELTNGLLASVSETGTDRFITSPAGTTLRAGSISTGSTSTAITIAQISANGGSADGGRNTTEIYDYVIEGVAIAGTTTVIIELENPIPADATLRKYSTVNNTWSDFDTMNNNGIESKEDVICDNDMGWIALNAGDNNLTENHNCLRLTLLDGGANDDDGMANGMIEDPLAIATPGGSGSGSGSSGGGCVYNPNANARFDLPLLLLGLLGGYYLLSRKRNKLAA